MYVVLVLQSMVLFSLRLFVNSNIHLRSGDYFQILRVLFHDILDLFLKEIIMLICRKLTTNKMDPLYGGGALLMIF